MSDTKKLSHLGSSTKYDFKKPAPEILETFDNQHDQILYLIPFIQPREEFTSLCPQTGQPDHAKMEIVYVPRDKCVESKSLKLYLVSYRNSGEFHEDVCNRIANDLFKLLNPYYLRVYGDFAPRGSLAIKPLIERWGGGDDPDFPVRQDVIRSFVNQWDLKAK